MKDNKEFIKGVYEKYEQYKKDENSKWKVSSQQVTGINKKKVAQKVLSYAAAITIAISGVVVTNNYINKNNEISRPSETKTSNKLTLKTVDNFENFYEIAKEYTKTTNNNARNLEYDDSLSINDSDYSKSSSLSPGSINQSTQESSNYSKTNIQVEDVDEADIVKTDGKYIYYVVGKKIIIADISKKDELSQISEIDFSTEKYTPSELYINKNKLIILGNENEYSYDVRWDIDDLNNYWNGMLQGLQDIVDNAENNIKNNFVNGISKMVLEYLRTQRIMFKKFIDKI